MSDAAIDTDVEHAGGHDHPSDLDYVKVFVALLVLTAIEVATFFIDMPTPMLIGSLGILMSVKIYLIAGWFMHLRVDNRLFTRFFITGIIGAVTVYLIMLSTFVLWDTFDF
ncbi:MAG: cytochrome C oxidase subunit IV family protein [Acidimicrobiia bacterium]|nr:cytochrome C oxidase subunit IV family protein [Acidimicrobiia bacterium]